MVRLVPMEKWLLIERGIFIIIISAFLLGVNKRQLVLCGWLIERGIFIIIISAFLLGVKANLFCTNRTSGMASFSVGTNRTIGTNGPSEIAL